jgi:hypothetical protein
VSLSTAGELDIAPRGERTVVDAAVFADVLTRSVLTGGEENREIELREERSLIVGLLCPSLDLLEPEFSVMDVRLSVVDV